MCLLFLLSISFSVWRLHTKHRHENGEYTNFHGFINAVFGAHLPVRRGAAWNISHLSFISSKRCAKVCLYIWMRCVHVNVSAISLSLHWNYTRCSDSNQIKWKIILYVNFVFLGSFLFSCVFLAVVDAGRICHSQEVECQSESLKPYITHDIQAN